MHLSFCNNKELTVWTWPEAHVWLMMGSLRACPAGKFSSKHLEQRKKTVEHPHSWLQKVSNIHDCLHLYQLGLCRSNQLDANDNDREFHDSINSRVVRVYNWRGKGRRNIMWEFLFAIWRHFTAPSVTGVWLVSGTIKIQYIFLSNHYSLNRSNDESIAQIVYFLSTDCSLNNR